MRGPSPRRLLKYVTGRLGLKQYLQSPGDGRRQPQIPARVLIWALLLGQLLPQFSFLAIEALAGSPAGSAAGVNRSFGDDTLAYFTERLDPALTRVALAATIRKAKRNKAFDGSRFIGRVVDGTGAGRRRAGGCKFCRPLRKKNQEVVGYHRFLFQLAKSRWEIENQGFNDAKNRYGMEHICHHHPHRMLTGWLLVALGLTMERLYRIRYLHRGNHPVRTAIELVRILWFHLAAPLAADTSSPPLVLRLTSS